MQQVQPWQIFRDNKYVVASQFGPTYSGPLGLLQFTNGIARHFCGLPREFMFGHELHGTKGLSVFYEYDEQRELQWIGDSWDYVKVEAPTVDPVVVFSIPEQPPDEHKVVDPNPNPVTAKNPAKRRVRRVRCSECDKLFSKDNLIDGVCLSCR